MITDGSRRARLTLAADLAAFGAFVVAGSRFHQGQTPMQVFLRNSIPFAGAWLFFSLLLGTYKPPSLASLFRTWAATIPLALILRAVWMSAPLGPWNRSFVLAAAGFTLAFLLGGRVLVSVAARKLGVRRAR